MGYKDKKTQKDLFQDGWYCQKTPKSDKHVLRNRLLFPKPEQCKAWVRTLATGIEDTKTKTKIQDTKKPKIQNKNKLNKIRNSLAMNR